MDIDLATDLVRNTLIVALLISSPLLIIGLIVGVFVSIIQALTQIQEQTLVFVPKILVMGILAIILMPWIGQRLMDFTRLMFETGLTP